MKDAKNVATKVHFIVFVSFRVRMLFLHFDLVSEQLCACFLSSDTGSEMISRTDNSPFTGSNQTHFLLQILLHLLDLMIFLTQNVPGTSDHLGYYPHQDFYFIWLIITILQTARFRSNQMQRPSSRPCFSYLSRLYRDNVRANPRFQIGI